LALVMRMKFLMLQSKMIQTDDTSIKMLEPGRGTTRTCKFWPYLGDWLHPYAVYDFTLNPNVTDRKSFCRALLVTYKRMRNRDTTAFTRARRFRKSLVGSMRAVIGTRRVITTRSVRTRR